MKTIKVRGFDIKAPNIRDSLSRRAVQLQNNIITNLRKIGVHEDYVEVELERLPMRKARASAEWYFDGHNLEFSYHMLDRFIDNLYVVSKLIELQVSLLLEDDISPDDFCRFFEEQDDDERLEARKTLGVEPDCMDFALITKNYKQLSKQFHPDMPGGDHDRFKEINHAHKLLKKELN